MKNIFITLIFVQIVNVLCIAQSFTYHSDSPFGITPVKADTSRSASKVMFYDFDLDGDLDLFMSGLDYIDDELLGWENLHYFLEMQENVGDRFNPVFAERTNAFDDFPFTIGLFFPAIGDVTGDGLTDFVINGEIDFIGNTTMLYAPNTGTKQNPEFEPIRFDSMGLDDFVTESFFDPALVDLDSDGDLDILMSGLDPAFAVEDGPDIPRFYYAKNFGTSKSPDFKGWYSDPYGLTPDTLGELTTVGDIDNDGDMDVVGVGIAIPADSIHSIKVHLNTPTPEGKPGFNGFLQSPFGLPVSQGEEQFLFPTLVDLDGDGDLDLFVFKLTVNGTILEYYENALCTAVINDLSVTLCEGESVIVGGNTYTDAGIYTISLENALGCDSTIQLSITVDPVQSTFLNESICEGNAFVVGDESFNTDGDYMVFLIGQNGCDSVVFLSLMVHETYQTNLDESICDGESVHIGDEEFTISGEYEVTLSSQAGCDSIVLLSLVVNENYNTNLNESICDGEVYSIGLEDFTMSGHYEVLLFSNAGCDSLVTLDLNVIEINNAVIVSENTIIANQFGVSYQWVNCDSGEDIPGATNQSYEVTVTGNYAVRLTDGIGCSVVSECVHVIITGLAEVAFSNAITIYPNPTEGWVNVINTSPFSISRLKVTNLSGQVMGEFLLNGKNSVDVSFLEQGVYFVEMNVTGVVVIKKLIILDQ